MGNIAKASEQGEEWNTRRTPTNAYFYTYNMMRQFQGCDKERILFIRKLRRKRNLSILEQFQAGFIQRDKRVWHMISTSAKETGITA